MTEEERFSEILREVVAKLTDREVAILNAAAEPLVAAIKENLEHSMIVFNRLSK